MEQLPFYIPALFIAALLLTLVFLFKATRFSRTIAWLSLTWLFVSGILAFNGFYSDVSSMPPHMLFAVLPPLALMAFAFASKRGRGFIDAIDPGTLTLLHLVRIPVELVLLFLFLEKKVPRIMTFEGNNLDILSGISAPVIYYLVFVRKKYARRTLLVWNILCLLLLLNIVITAILAVPYPFQQLAFDQPNQAVLYLPYIWLPAFIVPVVFFSHLVLMRQIMRGRFKV